MEPERWQRVEQIYHAALAIDSLQRTRFLAETCAGDPALQREVESLLAEADSGSFLASPAVEVAAEAMATSPRPLPAAIGRYRIIRLLGEGGMGAVYEAEQDQPRRTVALKVIRPGFATADLLRRFQHESQALGRLQHPGIAQIYEASTADTGLGPQPYFAMELIRGLPLHEYASAHVLSTRERLELMAKICDAVEHAHQRGVIHRDLKPTNILVDETGQPKILDFGVARVTDSDVQPTRQTDLGQLIGTLAYMSPEQVLGDPGALDTRSDVYALGVILYELLAGKLPYDLQRKPLHEAIITIQTAEPASLSTIDRTYRGDIATIAAKALEKDKAHRYASAADLAADTRRYLADQPIAARPASATYQLQKFARRHRALVAGTAAVFLVLAAGIIASTWEAVRALRAERKATAEAATAQAINDFLQNDLLAQASASNQAGPSTKPDPDLKVRTALDRAAARIPHRFDKQPEVEAAIRDTIGQTYIGLGLFGEAGRQFESALALHRRIDGPEGPRTLKTMIHLGRTTRTLGRYPEAETILARVVKLAPRVLGPSHPDTLYAMSQLGAVYMLQGKYSQAEPLQRETFEIRRRMLGPQHIDTIGSMNNLGLVFYYEGKYAEAEALHSQAAGIKRRVLGAEHPSTLFTMRNLANDYQAQGKYAQAEQLGNQIIETQSRALGPEHPETLQSMNDLASAYRSEGKYGQAEALHKQLVEVRGRVFGYEHPDTLQSMSLLSDVYFLEGKYDQAKDLCIRNLAVQRRVLKPDQPDVLHSINALAVIYVAQEKYAQAEPLFRECLEISRRLLHTSNPSYFYILSDLAAMYQRRGNFPLAESHLMEAVQGFRGAVGADQPVTLEALADLALADLSQEKFAESEPLSRAAVEGNRKKRPDHWQMYRAESLLGATLAGQKKYAEAEPLLLEGYTGMLARKDLIASPDRYHLNLAHEWLVRLYQAWGKPDKAAGWKKRSALK